MSTEVSQQKGPGRPLVAYTIEWSGTADKAGSIRLEVRLGTVIPFVRHDWGQTFVTGNDSRDDVAQALRREWNLRKADGLNVYEMEESTTKNYQVELEVVANGTLWVVWSEDDTIVKSKEIVPGCSSETPDVLGLSVCKTVISSSSN